MIEHKNIHIAYIGLGSNLDEPVQHVLQGLDDIREIRQTFLVHHSSLYQTPPMGPEEQDDYINAVALIETELAAIELLDALQAIENQHKRDRDVERWGPRTLDLDILLYGDSKVDVPRLRVPHIEMHTRSFVLLPLLEIAPNFNVPNYGPAKDLLLKLDCSEIRKLEHD